jgi:RND family efflux transporter MFP subunit
MNNQLKIIPIVIALLFITGCSKKEAPKEEVIRPVKAMKVGGFERIARRSFPGQARATQEANLSFRVNGPLVQFPVNVGDEVKKGQLLARIDPRDFEVELKNVRGQLARAKAALELARSDYDRVVRIRTQDPGAISAAMIDAKKGELDSSKAEVDSLSASVATAKDALSYTNLNAPFEGTVVETFVENYEDVRAKQPIVRLVDTSQIEFVVNVPENLISYAKKVTKVYVRFDTFPDREIESTIKEIGKEASKTTRTFPVTLIMDQPGDFRILPGMAGRTIRAEGDLPDAGISTGFEIPVTATFSDGTEASYVWIIDETTNRVAKREVTSGELTEDGIMITKGLKTGEWIATAGVHTLREGQQVRILK